MKQTLDRLIETEFKQPNVILDDIKQVLIKYLQKDSASSANLSAEDATFTLSQIFQIIEYLSGT